MESVGRCRCGRPDPYLVNAHLTYSISTVLFLNELIVHPLRALSNRGIVNRNLAIAQLNLIDTWFSCSSESFIILRAPCFSTLHHSRIRWDFQSAIRQKRASAIRDRSPRDGNNVVLPIHRRGSCTSARKGKGEDFCPRRFYSNRKHQYSWFHSISTPSTLLLPSLVGSSR